MIYSYLFLFAFIPEKIPYAALTEVLFQTYNCETKFIFSKSPHFSSAFCAANLLWKTDLVCPCVMDHIDGQMGARSLIHHSPVMVAKTVPNMKKLGHKVA